MGLINPDDFVIARATCESGGKTLHDTKDCPRDATCPVWISFRPDRDINGRYVTGTYEGREVHLYGIRAGFAYIAFVTDLGWVTKVPATWMEN